MNLTSMDRWSSNIKIMERLNMQRIQRHNEILQQNHETLVDKTEPTLVIEYLYQEKTIVDFDKKEILSRPTRRDKNEALLSKLRIKGPTAFPDLVNGLQIGQPYLACILLKEENRRLSLLEIELHRVKKEVLKLKKESERPKTKCRRSLEEPLQLPRDRNLQRLSHDERSGTAASNVKEGDNIRENRRLSLLEIELHGVKKEVQKLKTENERPKTKCRRSLEEPLQLPRDRNLQRLSHDERSGTAASNVKESDNIRESPTSLEKDNLGTPFFDNSTGRQSQRMAQGQRSRPSTPPRNEFPKTKEYHFSHRRDFDNNGVIYYLGFNAGVNTWKNPALVPSSGVKVTFCDRKSRGDPEDILEYFSPVNSYTSSGWCLDLGKWYTLKLTGYTLRQCGSNSKNFLQNFKIQGRLNDGDEWSLLSKHNKVNWKLREWSYCWKSDNKAVQYKTKTWSVNEELKAHRQFQIVQMNHPMPGTPPMSLAGIELYGVLSVPDFYQRTFAVTEY